ncbi:hypothetical protein SB719_21355, partial [Pantoea sp. SIMBA_079]
MLAEARDEIAIGDNAIWRKRDFCPAIDDVGHHHGMTNYFAAAQQLGIWGKKPQSMTERAFHNLLVGHRLGEEAN